MAQHHDLGRYGEQLAKMSLMQKGYQILEENWTYKHLEIDLIAYKPGMLIIVEVKTRSSAAFGDPEDFVGVRKQRHMATAANVYAGRMQHTGEIRFDVIAVHFNPVNSLINHIEDAFWPA